jgi:type IV secretory pathway protease TraF
MRKKLVLIAVAGLGLAGTSVIAPSPANAQSSVPKVEVRKSGCGQYNVYLNGQPVFLDTYGYMCPPPQQ